MLASEPAISAAISLSGCMLVTILRFLDSLAQTADENMVSKENSDVINSVFFIIPVFQIATKD